MKNKQEMVPKLLNFRKGVTKTISVKSNYQIKLKIMKVAIFRTLLKTIEKNRKSIRKLKMKNRNSFQRRINKKKQKEKHLQLVKAILLQKNDKKYPFIRWDALQGKLTDI